jgi:hypothetical protein
MTPMKGVENGEPTVPNLVARNLPPDVTPETFADFLWQTCSLAIDPQRTHFYPEKDDNGVPTGTWKCRFNLGAAELAPFLNLYFADRPLNEHAITFRAWHFSSQKAASLADFLGAIPAEQKTEQVGEEVELNRHGIRKLA